MNERHLSLALQLPRVSERIELLCGAMTYSTALASAAGGSQLDMRLPDGDRATVGVGLYRSPPYDLHVPALSVARLSVTLTAARVVGAVEGERVRSFDAGRHALFLAPAGAAAQWRKEAPSRHLNLYFHPHAFGDDDPEAPRLPHDAGTLLNASVPGVRSLADELSAELERQDTFAAEAVDSLARLLLIRVARQLHQRRAAPDPLTPALCARLHAFVEAHLDQRLLVADLAAVVGLSPNRFAHLWTARTGQSPHRFVVALRLQRAQTLLRQSPLGIAEIAAVCGFATQQHLTQAMRRHLGATPGRLRAALRR